MPENAAELLHSIRIRANWLIATTAVLFICGALVAGYVYIEAQTTHTALCALRGNLETQVSASKDFLAENPRGIPGISPEALRSSMQNQERAIVALSILSC